MKPTSDDASWETARFAAASALALLLLRTDEVADSGGFAAITECFVIAHPQWRAGRVMLLLGATPRLCATGAEPTDQRHLDVCVQSKLCSNDSERTILRGSKHEIIRAMQDPELANRMVSTMREVELAQRWLEVMTAKPWH